MKSSNKIKLGVVALAIFAIATMAIQWKRPARTAGTSALAPLPSPDSSPHPNAPSPHGGLPTLSPQKRAQIGAKVAEGYETYQELANKVIMTTDERAQFQRTLSDTHLIRRSFLLLAEVVPANELAQNQNLRNLATNYLTRGLEWSANPAREQIIESLKSLIILQNLGDTEDLAVRKSFAGDKVEAYLALRAHAPQAARELQRFAVGSPLRRLIAFAENTYQATTRNHHPR